MLVSTDGDYGDAVLTLGVMSGIPHPPHTLLARVTHLTKSKTQDVVDTLVHLLKRLVEAQPYMKEFRSWNDGDTREWDSGGFRLALLHRHNQTLLSAYRNHFKSIYPDMLCGDGTKAWLTCSMSPRSAGRVVINRTERYRNPFFPWKDIIDTYGDRLMFIGTKAEHNMFCVDFGNVDFEPTRDMLDVAELIRGSLLFIGNQSCANAIAEGLKHDLIQETSLEIPDCVFNRPNAQHVYDGGCILPSFDGGDAKIIRTGKPLVRDVDFKTVPPPVNGGKSGWILNLPNGKKERNIFFSTIVSIAKQHGMTREDAIEQNIDEYRDYFFSRAYSTTFDTAKQAIANSP